MANSSEPIQSPGGSTSVAPTGSPGNASAAPGSGPAVNPEVVRQLINQAIGFNLFAVPEQPARYGGLGNVSGFTASEKLHRFDVRLNSPSSRGVQATNTFGELTGKLDLQWF